jgi:hypothetical protein
VFPLLDQKMQRIKEKALDRMIENHGRNLRDAFMKWRNFNQIRGITDALTAE